MRKVVSSFLALSMLLLYVPTLRAAEPVKITHQKALCVPSEAQARLQCDVNPSTSIASVRVYFHSDAYKDDYFLEMRRGAGDRFFAVLPWVDTGITKAVSYRIVVKSADGTTSSTESATVPVSGSCMTSLSDDEKRYGSNLVVGLTNSGQPSVPQGFQCKGIVSVITANGEMKSHEDCRKLLAAAGAGTGAAVAAGGIPTGVYIGAGVVAAVGAGLIISNNTGGGGKAPVSSARPGAQPPSHY